MSVESQTPPTVDTNPPSHTSNILPNGDVGVVPKNTLTSNSDTDGSTCTKMTNGNGETANGKSDGSDSPPKSSTPNKHRRTSSIPMLTIKEDDDWIADDVVKGKPSGAGHSRKGSSVSQLSVGGVTSSTCSLSRENSFINPDTVSLPLTLEQLKNDTSARTTSDPALKLTADLSRDDLSDQERHETLTKLLEEVVALKLEIVNLKEENEVLRRARTEMDDELHQLTENLFEEAYKMVDEAKGGKADAEKKYLDAAGQIEAMETKVSALNNLLHTKSSGNVSSPSAPNKHKRTSVKKMIKKMSKRTLSSSSSSKKTSEPGPLLKQGELMTEEFKQFSEWVDKGLPLSSADSSGNQFLTDVLSMQINPCFNFKNEQLARKVKEAVENNAVLIEPLAGTSVDQEGFKASCALTDESSHPCSYRMKLGEGEVWHYISSNARNRIVSVCDFYVLVGYVQKGIVKKETVDLFWQMTRLRGAMSFALLNLSFQDSLLSS